MSDETYSVFMMLGTIAAAALLWVRFRQGRAIRRLLRSLKETNPDLFEDNGELKKRE